jgi:hypothetical protein
MDIKFVVIKTVRVLCPGINLETHIQILSENILPSYSYAYLPLQEKRPPLSNFGGSKQQTNPWVPVGRFSRRGKEILVFSMIRLLSHT